MFILLFVIAVVLIVLAVLNEDLVEVFWSTWLSYWFYCSDWNFC